MEERAGGEEVVFRSRQVHGEEAFNIWELHHARGHFFYSNRRIVIRHSAGRLDHTASDERVTLGPMDLKVAPSNRRQENAAGEGADFTSQNYGGALSETEVPRVEFVHKYRVSGCIIDGINLGVN